MGECHGESSSNHKPIVNKMYYLCGNQNCNNHDFKTTYSTIDTADHGNDDNTFHFIHSACSSGVTESKNTEAYYNRRYVGACRVL